jgi:hypothetical protein
MIGCCSHRGRPEQLPEQAEQGEGAFFRGSEGYLLAVGQATG